jgi:peptide/nickel transport system permease protein
MTAPAAPPPAAARDVDITAAPGTGHSALTTRPARTPWQLAFARLRKARLALLGLVVLAILALLAVFAPAVAPYGENEIDLFNITAPPSAAHWLGTDDLGRDELSRLIWGGRVSLLVGLATALLSTAIGVVVGAVAGYAGGWVDAALMRFVDVMLAFPAIFLLLILFSIAGSSVGGVILFLGLFSWMWLARIIRGEFLSLKQRDFVEAARAAGAPGWRIVLRHLLPNVVGAIVVATTLNMAYAMLSEATLSFLGFGVPPGTPTWGNMLNAARPYSTTQPLLVLAPGLTLTVAVLAINFLGDGLRDALDPRR